MNYKIEQFKQQIKERDLAQELEYKRLMQQFNTVKQVFVETCLPHLRQATTGDYMLWLDGFVDNGGIPTHAYNYELTSQWYVATDSFHLIDLYGAAAVRIIIPTNVTVTYDNLGHNTIYYMSDFSYKGLNFIPIYSPQVK